MVCLKAAEEMGENFRQQPIGTGPFMFEEYQPQQFVRLVANQDYLRGAPQIEEIIYRYIPSDASRDLAFQSGEVDMMFGARPTWVERMKQIPGTGRGHGAGELSVLHLNTTEPPLDDLRVRQAIAHAISRDAMVQLRRTVTRPSCVGGPQRLSRLHRASRPLDYDVENAKALLAEAGYPDGITLKSIASTLPAARDHRSRAGVVRDAKINLEIEPVDHPTYHAQIRKDLSR